MQYLDNLRFLGFTIFGFWISLLFWLSVAVYLGIKSQHRLTLLATAVVCAGFNFFTAVQTVSHTAYSVQMYSMSVLFVGFLIAKQYALKFSILEVGAISWLSAFFTDIGAASLVNNPALLHHGISLLPVDVLHMYFVNVPVNWHTIQAIGGAGLSDGLILLPIEVMLQVFISHKVMENRTKSAINGKKSALQTA
jgi:hypothetical protein